jgi:hypothetical protein
MKIENSTLAEIFHGDVCKKQTPKIMGFQVMAK